MGLFDKILDAVTPPESAEKRKEAHKKARVIAQPGDWLSVILDHHEGIEAAFAGVKSANGAKDRKRALKRLGILLNGHAMAEEATVYPAVADAESRLAAETAYTEQVAAKMQLAALELLDPASQAFLDKLLHHVYKEESEWLPELKRKADPALQAHVKERYLEEYDRYIGAEGRPGTSGTKTVSGEDRSYRPAP
jgi:hypothetical protein